MENQEEIQPRVRIDDPVGGKGFRQFAGVDAAKRVGF